MKKIYNLACVLILSFPLFFLCSCQKTLGYGVLLWDMESQDIADGTILKVLIKSNIMHQYIAASPQTDEKIQVPLWQLSIPASKKKALALKKSYSQYERTYAKVKLDGLPVREETVNTSKQVYRLKKGETVRILQKAKGQAVMAGSTELEGDWLEILTQDGTKGYCFSYNLDLFVKTEVAQKDSASTDVAIDEKENQNVDLPSSLEKYYWYAKDDCAMIEQGKIDLEKLETTPLTPAFFCGDKTQDVYLRTSEEIYWSFQGVKKIGEAYKYQGDVPLTIYIENEREITVVYETSKKNYTVNLKGLSKKIDTQELIQKERARRQEDFLFIFNKGPAFKSSSYGQIRLSKEGGFEWKNFRSLIPDVIPKGTKGQGKVQAKYYLSDDLKKEWDGVLSFDFEGLQKEINFLYQTQETGLKLKVATGAVIRGGTLTSVPVNSLVLFFSYGIQGNAD